MIKNEQELWYIYSTFPNHAEAISVARKLLESKLIACANVINGISSLYYWQEKLCEENEVILIAKTTAAHRQQALDTLVEWHSYDIPSAVLIHVPEASPAFAAWVHEQLKA